MSVIKESRGLERKELGDCIPIIEDKAMPMTILRGCTTAAA
jgi:hypothetical protein